jgi:hypothetical protein
LPGRAPWELLAAGAADVLAWDECPDPIATIVARIERWVQVEQLHPIVMLLMFVFRIELTVSDKWSRETNRYRTVDERRPRPHALYGNAVPRLSFARNLAAVILGSGNVANQPPLLGRG